MKKCYSVLCLLCVFAAQAFPHHAIAQASPLTLEDAWRRAEQNDIGLAAAQNSVAVAQAHAQDAAGFLWNNPEISAELLRRRTPQPGLGPTISREWAAGVSQTFELGGQQGFRRQVTSQDLAAAQYKLPETRRQLRAEVERRFFQVLGLQLRLANEREAIKISEDLATFASKRVGAGEDSKLDGNVALIEAGRARNQLASLADQLLTARIELAELLRWPGAESLPEVSGELEPRSAILPLERLLARAAERPQLMALRAAESAARSRLSLERAARSPDITLGLSVAREGPEDLRESVVGLTVSIPLPIFRRNAGNVAQASADLTRTQLELQAGIRGAEANVRTAWQRVQDLSAKIRNLREAVLPALDENQQLSQKALKEGEIGLAQLVVINRQVIEGRRDLIEALSELRLARVALEAAANLEAEKMP